MPGSGISPWSGSAPDLEVKSSSAAAGIPSRRNFLPDFLCSCCWGHSGWIKAAIRCSHKARVPATAKQVGEVAVLLLVTATPSAAAADRTDLLQ